MTSAPRSRQLALFLIIAGVAVLAALALLLVFADPVEAPVPTTAPSRTLVASEAPRVELEDARAAHEAGSAVFVDVRPAGSYAASHIPGALSIPLDALDARLDELDPGARIITYCT
jgi:3-mercaptopyruvate sulfurtransferase SseA